MFKIRIRNYFLLFVLAGCCANFSSARDTETDLRNAVDSMNHWLGSSEYSSQWRQLLNLNVLDAQSALGHRADPSALRNVRARFARNFDGLDHPAFQRVQECIDSHLEQLSRNNLDISFAAEQAKSQYAAVTDSDLEQLRDDAVFRISMLKRYYRHQLPSRERGKLFYALRPDQTIEFLQAINFELPPIRNKDFIDQEIERLRERIEVNKLQIEKLNNQRTRINEWKEQLQNQTRPDNVTPPSPEDDSSATDKPEEANTELSIDRETSTDQETETLSLQDEERIEQGRLVLLEENGNLEAEIERLSQESEVVAADEVERGKRFQVWLAEYRQIMSGFESVQRERFDSYFGLAYRALWKLRRTYTAAANPRTETQYAARLVELGQEYSKLVYGNDKRSAAKIGYLTGWLESIGQARDLIASVRAQHSKPNLYFELSSGLVNRFTTREISEYRRVNDQVLNRLIRGIALVEGVGQVQFVPDPYQVRAAIDLSGMIQSDTYTKSGRLTAYAGAVIPYNVRQEMFVGVGGMFANELNGSLNLQSYFKCIDSNLGFVQKIAQKQYQKSKALSESISEERTRKQIFDQFREQADETIAAAIDRFRTINQRRAAAGRLLPALYMFTTNDRIVGVGHQSTPFDLAATSDPVDFNFVPADVRLKMHESMISNYVSPIFAGRQLTNKQLTIEIADWLQREVDPEADQNAQEFSVRFDRARPIQIELENNLLGVTITGVFRRKGSRSRNNLQIKLAFRLETNGDAISIVPASDVSVELVDERQKNIGTASIISFLERILSDAFEKADSSKNRLPSNLIPVDRLEGEAKKIAKKMALAQLRIENGWLYAGWNYQPEAAYGSQVVDTPAISIPLIETDAPNVDFSGTDLGLEAGVEANEDASN